MQDWPSDSEANQWQQERGGTHARLDFRHDISLNLWGRNLTQTRYSTFAFDSSATGQTLYFAQRGAPLQVGANLTIHF